MNAAPIAWMRDSAHGALQHGWRTASAIAVAAAWPPYAALLRAIGFASSGESGVELTDPLLGVAVEAAARPAPDPPALSSTAWFSAEADDFATESAFSRIDSYAPWGAEETLWARADSREPTVAAAPSSSSSSSPPSSSSDLEDDARCWPFSSRRFRARANDAA